MVLAYLMGLVVAAAADGPCDILVAAGNPCVAAHSTVRALYVCPACVVALALPCSMSASPHNANISTIVIVMIATTVATHTCARAHTHTHIHTHTHTHCHTHTHTHTHTIHSLAHNVHPLPPWDQVQGLQRASHNVTRASDGKSALIGVLSAGGYANITQHDEFCNKLDCVISNVMDQSPMGNHLGEGEKDPTHDVGVGVWVWVDE
jgi:hypothetical protein